MLAAQPAEAEQALAHVVLADLLEDDLDEVLRGLSTPRRRALDTALHLDETADTVDPLALGIATRGALQVLAEERPLLLAIDDLQWLDDSSAGALAFALRRLGSTRVCLLCARRIIGGASPSGLERALSAEAVQQLAVGPLSVGALHRFLRDRLGRSFPRQTLLRSTRSGGNLSSR